MRQFIAIYLRVSSRSQSMRSQERDLQKWAEGQGLEVRWYKDVWTGTTMQRPALDCLLADVAAGRVAKIAIWRLDRLGRSCSGLVKLFDDLRAAGTGLVSLKDAIDLDTSTGRLVCHILASVAHFELELRRERQTAGIAAAKAAGKVWGGSKPGRRRITPEQEALIVRMRGEGTKIAAIARATGVSRPTCYAVLEASSINGQTATT